MINTFRAWPLHFCNLSGAIYVSTVRNWVCYSKIALKAVGEEFKIVTIEAVKAWYTAPADTDSSCPLWRQLEKTVKAWFPHTKSPCFDGLQEVHHKTRKKPNSIMPLPRPPWCWSPLMLILPPSGWWEQCLLAHTAAAWAGSSDKPPQHLVFLAWKATRKTNKCGTSPILCLFKM